MKLLENLEEKTALLQDDWQPRTPSGRARMPSRNLLAKKVTAFSIGFLLILTLGVTWSKIDRLEKQLTETQASLKSLSAKSATVGTQLRPDGARAS